jgi:hypothetical protein
MMVAAKTEDLEFSPPYLENFSNIDAQKTLAGGNLRPTPDAQKIAKSGK